jgi:hypothetical protein
LQQIDAIEVEMETRWENRESKIRLAHSDP